MSQRQYKYSVILNNYNKPSDRFLAEGYGTTSDNRGVYELIDLAGKQGQVEGLELLMDDTDSGGTWIGIGPSNKKQILEAMDRYGLKLASILPNLWGRTRYSKGTFSAADPKIRRETIDMCKKAIDLAAETGCPYIGLWPGHDGFDYYFETDYQKLWDLWVEAVREIANHNPQVKIGLEPKPDEPRAYSLISSVSKALLMVQDTGCENVGICLDIGHSLYGHENLGEVISLMQTHGKKLFHMHINDNYRGFDLDMIFGSIHTIEFIEMFYWLRKTQYSHFMSIDLMAYRTDPTLSIEEGVKWMKAFDEFVEKVGLSQWDALVKTGDPIETQKFLRQKLFAA